MEWGEGGPFLLLIAGALTSLQLSSARGRALWKLLETHTRRRCFSPVSFPPFLLPPWIHISKGCEVLLQFGFVCSAVEHLAFFVTSFLAFSFSFFFQSRKHASKVRLYYMLHPIDGGCPAKKLRSENVGIIWVPVYSTALWIIDSVHFFSVTATDNQVPRGNI